MSGWARRRTQLIGIAVVVMGLLGAGVVNTPVVAAPKDGIVINEVFTRGGSLDQPFTHKFVELYNRSTQDVSLEGWSLQYRSKGNSGTNKANLSGTITAGGYFLIQGGQNSPAGGPFGDPLPAPDIANVSINPAGDGGIVALVSSTKNLSLPEGDITRASGLEKVIDLLGYGSAAVFEGEPASSPPRQGSIQRVDGVDTGNNLADFVALERPNPMNSGSLASLEKQPGTARPSDSSSSTCEHVPQGRVQIADVQGERDATPFLGCQVTTAGVVTATYPTGGFNGVYIQTPGTGGEIDLETHTASHGIFVRSKDLAREVDIGDYIEVTGDADEYYELTQITRAAWEHLDEESDDVEPSRIEWPGTDEERERFEGMLIAPQGSYTVTDLHEAGVYGQVGLAFGETPLRQPTEYARPGSPQAKQIERDNAARALSLDDGATWNYTNFEKDYHNTVIPYLSHENPVRVGAGVTFDAPMILEWRNGVWKLQPTSQVTGDLEGETRKGGQISASVTFANTREVPPQVEGNLKVGTFNVFNYFVDLGVDEHGCDSYVNRDGTPTNTKRCEVRGAHTAAALELQTSKVAAAITEMDVDVLALQEMQNTLHFPSGQNPTAGVHPRDVALARLVEEINAVAGPEEWEYVPSPQEYPGAEDVIRNAFIYRPTKAEPVGESDILIGSGAFRYGREPLAQAFTRAGTQGEATEVLLVTTHLKSKASGTGKNADQSDGQGASNATRIEQATATADYIDSLIAAGGPEAVLILGDLNSYTYEDPLEELHARGYENITSNATGKKSYSFDGMVGSLDHALGNEASTKLVRGADIWSINAYEAEALEYTRFNYNVAPLFQDSPFRSSDHDPLVLGLDLGGDEPSEPVAETPRAVEAGAEAQGAPTLVVAVIGLLAAGIIISVIALLTLKRRRG